MKPPRCGVHIGAAMALVETKAPAWLFRPDGADEMDQSYEVVGGTGKKQFQRRFWKCSVPGCVRVAAFAPAEEKVEKKDRACTSCGAPMDADWTRCPACIREKRQHRRSLVEKRVRKCGPHEALFQVVDGQVKRKAVAA